MSLTSLLDTHPDLVQALVGLVPAGAIPPPVTTPMLAHPVTDHYALVGTSFDYLFRFEVQRRFPRARTQRWVAEQAVSMLGKGPGDERARARKVVLAARKNQREDPSVSGAQPGAPDSARRGCTAVGQARFALSKRHPGPNF